MKFDLNKNPLKQTIGGNTFALSGMLFFVLYSAVFVFLMHHMSEAGTTFAIAIILIAPLVCTHLLLIAVSILIFFIELRCKHRVKNNFFSENKIYSVIFYLGTLPNIALLIFIFYLYIGGLLN